MSNSDARKSNSREDFHVGKENINDAIPLEGVQEVEGVEEASRDDNGVQQSSNRKSKVCENLLMFGDTLPRYTLMVN